MKTSKPIAIGDSARVDLETVRAFDPSAPYVALVRQIVRKGNGSVYVASLPPIPAVGAPAVAYIRTCRNDFIGDVRVPLAALSPA